MPEVFNIRAVTLNTACSVIGAEQVRRAYTLARDLHKGKTLDRYQRDIQENISTVLERKPDVVALQEVYEGDQEVLSEKFSECHYAPAVRPKGSHNIGTFVATLRPSQPIELPTPPPVFWGIAGRRSPDENKTYLSVHGPQSQGWNSQLQAWEYLSNVINQEHRSGQDVIILGDFNIGFKRIRHCLQELSQKTRQRMPFIPGLTRAKTFRLKIGSFEIPEICTRSWTDPDLDNGLFFPKNPDLIVQTKAQASGKTGTGSDHALVEIDFTVSEPSTGS